MGDSGDQRAPELRTSRELQRSDARTRLVVGHEVAARRPAALRTLRETEISVAAGIAPRGRRTGRWRRSARGLVCLICWRAESSAQSTSYGRSRASVTDLDVL